MIPNMIEYDRIIFGILSIMILISLSDRLWSLFKCFEDRKNGFVEKSCTPKPNLVNPIWLVVWKTWLWFVHFIYGRIHQPLTNSYFSRWLKPPWYIEMMIKMLLLLLLFWVLAPLWWCFLWLYMGKHCFLFRGSTVALSVCGITAALLGCERSLEYSMISWCHVCQS